MSRHRCGLRASRSHPSSLGIPQCLHVPGGERALPIAHSTLAEILAERVEISTMIAFRVAKAFDVSLQEVLTGEAARHG